MYSVILFDLDGTLTDPAKGITNSVAYALRFYGIDVKEKSELNKFIGPPLIGAFEEYYKFSHDQATEALAKYREYFSSKGIFENKIYDGINEMLSELRKRGKRLIVATSKPDEFAVKILKHFDIYGEFEFVAGATMDEKRTNKADVIEYALASCGISDRRECLMVGDRKHDIIGASKCGLDSMGVLYGYGDHSELTDAGATYLAERVSDILEIIK